MCEQGEDRPAQARLDCQLAGLARPVCPVLRPLMGPHRSIGLGRGMVAGEFARQRTRGSAEDVSRDPEAIPCGQEAA